MESTGTKRPRDPSVLSLLKEEWGTLTAEQKQAINDFINPPQIWGLVKNSTLDITFKEPSKLCITKHFTYAEGDNVQAWFVKEGDWKEVRFQFVKVCVYEDRPNGLWRISLVEKDDGTNHKIMEKGTCVTEEDANADHSNKIIGLLASEEYDKWTQKGYRPLTPEERIKWATVFKVAEGEHDGEEYEEPEEEEEEEEEEDEEGPEEEVDECDPKQEFLDAERAGNIADLVADGVLQYVGGGLVMVCDD